MTTTNVVARLTLPMDANTFAEILRVLAEHNPGLHAREVEENGTNYVELFQPNRAIPG